MDYFATAPAPPPAPTIQLPVIILIVCSFIILVFLIANTFLKTNQSLGDNLSSLSNFVNTSKTVMVVSIIFIVLPFVIMQIYEIHCILNGNCAMFVWFLTAHVVIFTLIYIAIFVKRVVEQKRLEKIAQEKTV